MSKLAGFGFFIAGWILASLIDGLLSMCLSCSGTKTKSATRIAAHEEALPGLGDLQTNQDRQSTLSDWLTSEGSEKKQGGIGSNVTVIVEEADVRRCKQIVSLITRRREPEPKSKEFARKRFEQDKGLIANIGYTTALILACHNIPEGVVTYAGAAQGTGFGIGLAVAIGLHNIPEGIAVAVPIYLGTNSMWKAMLFTTLSGLAEPLGGLLAYFVVGEQPSELTFGCIFLVTCGVMINVAINELYLGAIRYDPSNKITSTSFFCGMVVMGLSLICLDQFT